MGSRRRGALVWVAIGLLFASLAATSTAVAVAPPLRGSVKPCSNGLVALTFDDGPSTTVTPRLLDVLVDRGVPATFFVVGSRVAAAPRIVRRMQALGFDLANHSYRHERLTQLSSDAIRATLRRTRRAVTATGAEMTNLMRPPYGLINARVRSVVTGMGLTPVFWTVDPRDWEGPSSATIADRVVNGLRPDRPNVVLLHDGVANSPSTLRAVPDIIRRARQRGYCFAGLGPGGRPVPPIAFARVHNADPVVEGTGEERRLRFQITLNRPTSRPTSVWLRTEDRSAKAGKDYAAIARRLYFPAGTTRRVVAVRVFGDSRHERRERLVLKAKDPRGIVILDVAGAGWIKDDDPPPEVALGNIAVLEPLSGSVMVNVPVTLSRESGRRVTVTVTTTPVTATAEDFVPATTTVVVPVGEVSTTVPIEVMADELDEEAEQFSVVIEAATRATVVDDTAIVTINPPLSLLMLRQLPLP